MIIITIIIFILGLWIISMFFLLTRLFHFGNHFPINMFYLQYFFSFSLPSAMEHPVLQIQYFLYNTVDEETPLLGMWQKLQQNFQEQIQDYQLYLGSW